MKGQSLWQCIYTPIYFTKKGANSVWIQVLFYHVLEKHTQVY